jgi:hypothetical protein
LSTDINTTQTSCNIKMTTEDAYRVFDPAIRAIMEHHAYNVTIGGDGSIEVLKDFEIVQRSRIEAECPENTSLMVYMISALRTLNDRKIPNGLKIDHPDLRGSVFTTIFDGSIFGEPKVSRYVIGIYGSELSPEASSKRGYIILKPEYTG